ncbi:tetratricopeptide repeat protein [Planctomicrobium sp. SH527]|uniref:tetratricopeptide repeat protein n=1 Tax=Planctomicrobium sp. SH527 TaxID=3448123 RepID=UPI003F5BE696
MKRLSLVLWIVIAVELVAVVGLYLKPQKQPAPILPDVVYDDPLIGDELVALAKTAQTGKSVDWQLLGEALLGQGFYGEAELAFARAVKLDPQNAGATFGVAYCLDRTGRVEESIPLYERAAEIAQPGGSPLGSRDHCWYQVGRNLLREEKIQEAENLFKNDSNYPPAAYQYAKILVRSGRAEQALPVIDRVLKIVPTSLKFQSLRVHACDALGMKRDEYIASQRLDRSEYQIPIDFNSSYVGVLFQRYGLQNQIVECERLLHGKNLDAVSQRLNELLKILEATNHIQKFHLRKSLVQVEFQRGKPDAMLESIEILRKQGMSDPDMLQMEGAAYSLKKEMDKAAEFWLKAAQMAPNVPLHEKLAEYYGAKGDEKNGRFHAGHAALLKTKILFWEDKMKEAYEAVFAARQLIPEDPQVWFYSARIAQSQNARPEAIAEYKRCLELAPNHGRAQLALEFLSN